MNLAERGNHQKLQEMCDCYLETDFLPQLENMVTREGIDPEEDALKYLALTIMLGISEKARKISFKRKTDKISVSLKNKEKIVLPAPQADLFDQILLTMRSILHIEQEKGEMRFSIGLRNDQLDLLVQIEKKEDKEKLTIKFPPL